MNFIDLFQNPEKPGCRLGSRPEANKSLRHHRAEWLKILDFGGETVPPQVIAEVKLRGTDMASQVFASWWTRQELNLLLRTKAGNAAK